MNPAPAVSAFTERPHAQALLAWSSAQQRSLQETLARLLIDWQTAWSLDRAPADMSITTPTVGRASDSEANILWSLAGVPAERAEAEARRALEATLFGNEVHAPAPMGAAPVIALEVARAAWSDWQRRLQAILGASLAPSSGEQHASHGTGTAIWSGALCAELPWCGTRWSLLLPGAHVQRLLKSVGALTPVSSDAAASSPAPLVPLADALHAQALALHARLADVTLTLGELEHLSIGDVVLLPQRLDAPLQLMGSHDEVLCKAWLGQQAGRVALELAPLTHPA